MLPRLVPFLLLAPACTRPADVEPAAPALPAWMEVLEHAPAPGVVAEPELRRALAATGLPWRVRHKSSGIELLLVPPGAFQRGASPGDEEARDDERPRHTVVVRDPFWLGRYEVTQAEWRAVTGESPSHFQGPDRPVEQVPYATIQDFLERTGLALPTESQWEYACRAGDERARHGALDRVAWHQGNAGMTTHPIGLKAPNALGFHDTLGNVWEWTSTWYEEDAYAACLEGADEDSGPPGGLFTVLRGGSWYDPPLRARASARYRAMWPFSAGHVGFRVAHRARVGG